MNIRKATEKYEAWLVRHLRIVAPDLQFKHEQMRTSPFPFLRATYYRWAQIRTEVCGEAARAPRVLAVGDLHVENFGTWRDIEGRLVWISFSQFVHQRGAGHACFAVDEHGATA